MTKILPSIDFYCHSFRMSFDALPLSLRLFRFEPKVTLCVASLFMWGSWLMMTPFTIDQFLIRSYCFYKLSLSQVPLSFYRATASCRILSPNRSFRLQSTPPSCFGSHVFKFHSSVTWGTKRFKQVIMETGLTFRPGVHSFTRLGTLFTEYSRVNGSVLGVSLHA